MRNSGDLFDPNISGNERYVAQTKGRLGRRENNMIQNNSIKLGVIVMCVATVSLSLAQTPGTGTGGSKQTGAATSAAPAQGGSSGKSTGGLQTGANARTGTNTGTNANPSAQTGISNQAGGITAAAAGHGGSNGNLTATQTPANVGTGANPTPKKTGAETSTDTGINIIRPQLTPLPTQAPLPNNDPLGPDFSTPGQSPSPLSSASVTPTRTPTPTPVL
jgi:hypothetical protein